VGETLALRWEDVSDDGVLYAHESEARKQAALAANPGTVGHVLGTPGWAEQKMWRQSDENAEGKSGGRQEARTPDLRVANAALSQLS
jgi:hypothetical protein